MGVEKRHIMRHTWIVLAFLLKIVNSQEFIISKPTVVKSKVDGLKLELTMHYIRNKQPDFIVIMVHGYGDTSKYYYALAEHLAKNHNIASATFDQRQHGIHKNGRVPDFQ